MWLEQLHKLKTLVFLFCKVDWCLYSYMRWCLAQEEAHGKYQEAAIIIIIILSTHVYNMCNRKKNILNQR